MFIGSFRELYSKKYQGWTRVENKLMYLLGGQKVPKVILICNRNLTLLDFTVVLGKDRSEDVALQTGNSEKKFHEIWLETKSRE